MSNIKKTTEQFIEEAILVHGNRYDYSFVEYVNNKTKVKIKCEDHGIFWQIPYHHLTGCECPDCKGCKKMDTKSFIEKAIKIHGDEYDYKFVKYVNSKTKVKIKCEEHGIFEQIPNSHLLGYGCKDCGYEKTRRKLLKILDVFIEQSNLKHNNKYSYKNTIYKGAHIEVEIVCDTHGSFFQTPHSHLKGCGCSVCNESHGEKFIKTFLINSDIRFEQQKTFDECKYISKLKFDFYLPEYNICIEFDGKQHFESCEAFGGEEAFKSQLIKDNIKTKYCKNNNIKLYRITYMDNYEKRLISILEDIKTNNIKW